MLRVVPGSECMYIYFRAMSDIGISITVLSATGQVIPTTAGSALVLFHASQACVECTGSASMAVRVFAFAVGSLERNSLA